MRRRTVQGNGSSDERGFVLATVLVFLVVLTMTAFTSAALTRTDIQLVNNRYNERRAFYAAEAGVAEALLRLSMTKSTNVTVDGSTFDASFAATSFKPNSAWTDWRAQILFSGSAPQLDAGNHLVTTPTLQPVATRLAYSVPSAGGSLPLTIQWSLCTAANVSTGAFGCTKAGDIRTVKGVNALEIVSTGTSGAAQRTVTMMVTNAPDLPSVLTSRLGCDNKSNTVDGIKVNGSSSLEVSGGIWVNSSCDDAIAGVGSSEIHAGASIDVVGGVHMQNAPQPRPKTGADPMADPLAALLPPCFGTIAGSSCQAIDPAPVVRGGSALLPVTTKVSGGTLSPGVYYGGLDLSGGTITMNPGVYIMAGGGFSVSKNGTTIRGTGVTIYNTQDDVSLGRLIRAGQYGGFRVTTNATIDLAAPSSSTAANPYVGVVLFQDRANTDDVSFQGGQLDGVIDGVIYAINADMRLQGGHLKSNLLVSTLELQGSPEIDPPTAQPSGTGGGLGRVAWKDF